MMQFTTPVPLRESESKIGYDSRIFSIGSCFAVNIAEKLSHFKFRNSVNPMGILFHPHAIESFMDAVSSGKQISEDEIIFQNDRWHCFDAHSDMSDPSRNRHLEKLNDAIAKSKGEIENSSHIILTLGTAWIYRLKSTGKAVANCHKVPQSEFQKELLSVTQIGDSLTNTIALLRNLNKDARIIFTISPVRHLKDGFVENQRSKSNLISALHGVLDQDLSLEYFPSYEIVMDELRDYRFYAEDMIHPNMIAIDYIWERFSDNWISSDAGAIMKEVDAIQKSLAHKPFDPESERHLKFRQSLVDRIGSLQTRFPFMTFKMENT